MVFLHIKSLPNLLFGVLCLPGDQSPFAQLTINRLACCICRAGLLGHAVFPPWNEGPNFGSYNSTGSPVSQRIWSPSWEWLPGSMSVLCLRLQRFQFRVHAYNSRMDANWYHHQSVTRLKTWFLLMLFVLSYKTWNAAKPGAWVTRPAPGVHQSQDSSPIISRVLRVLLTAGSHSQSGQSPDRSEARSEACSALSLKPKQDYSFNFPNTISLMILHSLLWSTQSKALTLLMKAEVDVFLESGLYIWKFSVHLMLKPSLEILSMTLLAYEMSAVML